MRFTVILIALALLPVMVAVQVWDYSAHHAPKLAAQARAILQKEGVRAGTVDLRYLDLSVTGDAADVASMDRATAALKALQPTRLVHNGLSILAHLSANLQGQTLKVEGWLPDDCQPADIVRLLKEMRPDLKVDTAGLRNSPQVRWQEGEKLPLAADSLLIKGVVTGLRVSPRLDFRTQNGVIVLSGILPDAEVREKVVTAVTEAAPRFKVNDADLRVTRLVEPAAFARAEALAPFLRSFYGTPVPGTFSIATKGKPHLQAAATATLESEWLGLLRPMTGGTHVEMELTLYPSVYHIPGYQAVTPLPAEKLESLRQSLSDFYIVFDPASSTISASSRARLAGLVPTLLAAGPSLRLVIGGHPEAGGQPAAQRRLALARAEQVVSYLIEQGAPAVDIQALAFDPVPAGTPGAPLQDRSVEILIK